MTDARTRKFRQAAFVYLHLGVLYEAAVIAAWRGGALTQGAGIVALWLLAGAAIVAVVFWALWWKQSVWVARVIWVIGIIRLPFVIQSAFVDFDSAFNPLFYLTALIVLLINLAFLARAGWDL